MLIDLDVNLIYNISLLDDHNFTDENRMVILFLR